MIDHIKLLDLGNPKQTKDTVNLLIDLYNAADIDLRALANEANNNASEALSLANEAFTVANNAEILSTSANDTSIKAKQIAEESQNIAEEAASLSTQASDKADRAYLKAEDAIEIAETADSVAVQAKADSVEALTKSDNAVSTANTANTTANEAKTIATSIDAKAQQALDTANTANTTASTANTKSDNALSTANAANTLAESKADAKYVDKKIAELEGNIHIENNVLYKKEVEVTDIINPFDNYYTKSEAQEKFTTGKVLWTNPNPTAEFTPQNITLSSADYDFLEIYFYNTTGEKFEACLKIEKGEKGLLRFSGIGYYGTANDSIQVATRNFEYVNDLTYSVSECIVGFWRSSGNYNALTRNSWCVPIKIVGYKL